MMHCGMCVDRIKIDIPKTFVLITHSLYKIKIK